MKKRIGIVALIVILLLIAGLSMMSIFSPKPTNLGVTDG
jgi:hypothetical protein